MLITKQGIGTHLVPESRQLNNTMASEIMSRLQPDKNICYYCTKDITNRRTKEHIIPVSKGGNNKEINLVYACRECNYRRGNKDLGDYYYGMCRSLAETERVVALLIHITRHKNSMLTEFTGRDLGLAYPVQSTGTIRHSAQNLGGIRVVGKIKLPYQKRKGSNKF